MKRVWRKIKNRFGHSRHRRPHDFDLYDSDYDANDIYYEVDAFDDGGAMDGRIGRARDRYMEYFHLLSMLARMDLDMEAQVLQHRRLEQSPLPPALEETPTPAQSARGDQKERSEVSPETEMRTELSCPVCARIFTDPLISPCLHSLCSSCAQTLLSSDNKGKCPVCKEEITRDELKKNYPLKGIVEAFSRRIGQASEKTGSGGGETRGKKHTEESRVVEGGKLNTASSLPQIRQCDLCGDPPDWYCIQCEVRFCRECLNGFHPTLESTPDHTIISLHAGTGIRCGTP